MTDEGIVTLYWQRKEQAIRETEQKYGGQLLRLSENILFDRREAEECVSDTYLAAWNTIPPKSPVDYFFAYLARITRNGALDRWRKAKSRKRDGLLVELSQELEQCLPSPDDVPCRVEAGELMEILNSFFRSLEQRECDVFLGRYWFCTPVAELARRQGMTQSGIKSMLLRTRQKLRQYLEKEGYHL